jgi:outer membrane protein OmpA-like peptidoglycan-associated protein
VRLEPASDRPRQEEHGHRRCSGGGRYSRRRLQLEQHLQQAHRPTVDAGTQIVEQPDGSLKASVPSQVAFDADSATIKTAFRRVLDQVAQTIAQEPGVTARVVGHGDSVGNPIAT